ncbi:MAG: hypothetical protein QOI61_252, partial [Actinomycetota bacterium]
MSLSFSRLARRRAMAVLGAAGIVAGVVGITPARAAVPFKDAAFSGSAVGSTVHTDALNSGETRIANADIALASSAVNSKGITAQATNENGRVINPALGATKFSYGRGQGLEVGIAGTPPDDGQILLAGKAEASALPSPADDNESVGPVDADPVAWAAAAQGTANARWNTETCILGEDIARGIGYVADAQLVDAGADEETGLDGPVLSTDATQPFRDVSQTTAGQYFAPNSAGAFGLTSYVAQTIAPVSLLRGNLDLTVEVLGEWVMKAFASGVAGQSTVTYRPTKDENGNPVTDSTPILRFIVGADPVDITTVLTFQQVFGEEGFSDISIPGVLDLVVGEDPRAIGGDATTNPAIAADGTSVAAAVDVVRLVLADGALGDVRIGHMETKATVPAGGVTCPIPVNKVATPPIVNSTSAPDGKFLTTITIKNAFACPLENVTMTDDIIRKTGDVTFEIDENNAGNDPKKGAGAVFTKNSSTSAKA